jgi:hypothetical protein
MTSSIFQGFLPTLSSWALPLAPMSSCPLRAAPCPGRCPCRAAPCRPNRRAVPCRPRRRSGRPLLLPWWLRPSAARCVRPSRSPSSGAGEATSTQVALDASLQPPRTPLTRSPLLCPSLNHYCSRAEAEAAELSEAEAAGGRRWCGRDRPRHAGCGRPRPRPAGCAWAQELTVAADRRERLRVDTGRDRLTSPRDSGDRRSRECTTGCKRLGAKRAQMATGTSCLSVFVVVIVVVVVVYLYIYICACNRGLWGGV